MKTDNLLLELLLQNSRVIIQTRSISATFGDAKSAFNIQKECFGTNLQLGELEWLINPPNGVRM